MAWGEVSDFGQGFGLGSGFDGVDLGTIDTASPPLADNSNGSAPMQSMDWSSLSWIGGALDKALNFSLQKDQMDYQSQIAKQNQQLQAAALYRQQYGYGVVGATQPLNGRQLLVYGAIGLGIFMLVSK
jgi:hypothetical protein